jgi:DNA primase, catalytic core
MGVSNSTIEELKSQINIVDVIGRCVPLKRAGSNYKGVCPFHSEKTPSFVVSDQKQIFTCFGCGATGDVIEFVQRFYNLDFTEAVDKLAGEYGITIEKRGGTSEKNEEGYNVNKMAAQFFYKCFTEKANKGYSYMKNRGISPAILKKFGIGYADEEWDSLYKYMTAKGVDKKTLLELGLISESKGKCYDKFRNRVMFPIINTRGKVIGFGGRAIAPDDNPKYLNSPESRIFQKKNNLYGLNISRQTVGKDGFIILVEGYMDTISLFQSGVENVAASLGTALTENQARLIKRYTSSVVLSYDADSAGRAAALRGIEILKAADCRVRVLHVNDGKDPDEYVKKNGKKAFLKLIDGALPYGDYKLEAAKIGFDLESNEGRIGYLKKAAEIIGAMSPVEQEVYIAKVAKDIGVAEGAIRLELRGAESAAKPRERRQAEQAENKVEVNATPLERILIKLMLTDENYIDKVAASAITWESGFAQRVFETMRDEQSEDGTLDIVKVMDSIPDDDAQILQDICDSVVIGANVEQVFLDCVRTWNEDRLKKEEQQLISLLSMADEEEDQEKIAEFTDKLLKVQQELKNSR